MPKVYSYTRFSSPEQAKGDSARRQTAAAAKWAADRGLALDDTLHLRDEGVSAYRGTNTGEDRGLGGFLELCRHGLIEPGSYLLVESLDRISRMVPRRAMRLIEEIAEAGVTVVTLSDGQEYSLDRLDTDPTAHIISFMVAVRAHEESKTKGRRVAAAWEEKRRRARVGEPGRFTLRAPSWLRPAGEGWSVDPERAAAVRRIFALTLEGLGEHRIADTLNADGVTVLERGKRWHRSTVSKVLRNPAVIGHLVPGRIEHIDGIRRRVLEAPIPGVFPAIISETDWLAVRALKDGNSAAVRGRGAHAPIANILAGLARCPICGDAMTRVYKGSGSKGGKPKLVCTRAKAGGDCRYVSVDLAAVEAALIRELPEALQDVPAGQKGGHLDNEYERLSAEIEGTRDHIDDLAEALAAAPSRTGAVRLAKCEAELRTMQDTLIALDQKRQMADGGLVAARVGELHRLVEDRDPDLVNRPAINAALKVLLQSVVVDYPNTRLLLQWRQGGESPVQYAYAFSSQTRPAKFKLARSRRAGPDNGARAVL